MLRKIATIAVNPILILLALMLFSFCLHVANIGYNSPSGDEAVYISVGKNAIFNGKWGLYDTASWIGGHSYFYPTVSAIAYTVGGGIDGTRTLNVIFSIICLFFVSKITFDVSILLTKNKLTANVASIFAVVLVGFSAVTAYASRLATYDMPSFTLITAGIYFLVRGITHYKKEDSAREFLVSAILMALSFAFKYATIIYMPVTVLFSYLYISSLPKKPLNKTWITYFIFPLALFLLIVTLTQVQYLTSYIKLQLGRQTSSIFTLYDIFIKNTFSILPFWLFGSFVLILKKRWQVVLVGLSFALSIIALHFATFRIADWDIHLFLIILPLAITSGIGLGMVAQNKILRTIFMILLVIYTIFNIFDSKKYNTLWPNHTQASNFLSQNLESNDNLLAEEVSDLLKTNKTTTFDWFSYKGQVGASAYKKAINDGYFNYIELSSGDQHRPEGYDNLEKEIAVPVSIGYIPVYNDKYFTIYKRGF